MAEIVRDDRALSPVVEKSLAAGITLVYITGMLGLLLGGIVPGFQAGAGEQLGERTAATAAGHIEDTATAPDGHVDVSRTVDLPETIDATGYWLTIENDTLVLDHPDSTYDVEIPLALPAGTTGIESRWESGGELRIRVSGPTSNRTVALEDNT